MLFEKLHKYGFDSQSMKRMQSYLNNRRQMFEVSDDTSIVQKMNIGTPQGS